MFYYNLANVFFSKNNKCSSKSKCIELKYLIIHKKIREKKVFIEHINIKLMIIDLMTKALEPKVYINHVLVRIFWTL